MNVFGKSMAAAALAGGMCLGVATPAFAQAKNVILMVSDGIGFNGWEAAKYYQGGLPYDTADFDFYGMTNYPAGGEYDPNDHWSDFDANMDYDTGNITGSAASGTALHTGHKTENGRVNVDPDGNQLLTVGERAAQLGKATGAVSSVQYNHATPATVAAHNVARGNYGQIAAEMLSSDLDVIMGGDSRDPGPPQIYTDAANAGFTVVNDDDLSDWDDLADGGQFKDGPMPNKVFGGFGGSTLGGRDKPTLETMTKASLSVLEQDDDGMYLMVEGGAVDWENHGNDMEEMLREQVDFDNSVKAVMDWVEDKSSWEETLLIVTSDHETGGIWGPEQGTFDNVEDAGVGNIPVSGSHYFYNSGGHTNTLVPFWVRGKHSELFEDLVDGVDTEAADFWTQFAQGQWDGSYIDNTDVGNAMFDAVPEPSSLLLLGLGGLALARRRRA